MKVSIVIPNWNGKQKLANNLPGVLKVKGVNEIIIVDDYSTDDSVDFIKQNFPQIELIEKENNSGFAKTVNLGVARAPGDIVFLLNSDALPQDDVVEKAIKHFKDPQVFSVGCNTGGNWSWAKFERGYFWHYMSPKEKKIITHQTLWASGGSGLFRKSIWKELGGLDEVFSPFYEEDTDLGYRATKRGYINLWEPSAKVLHYHQKGVIEENFSKSQINKIAQRNQLFLIWKNITDSKFMIEHIFTLIKMVVVHPFYSLIVFSALVKLPQLLQKRSSENIKAKLSDREILAKYSKVQV